MKRPKITSSTRTKFVKARGRWDAGRFVFDPPISVTGNQRVVVIFPAVSVRFVRMPDIENVKTFTISEGGEFVAGLEVVRE